MHTRNIKKIQVAYNSPVCIDISVCMTEEEMQTGIFFIREPDLNWWMNEYPEAPDIDIYKWSESHYSKDGSWELHTRGKLMKEMTTMIMKRDKKLALLNLQSPSFIIQSISKCILDGILFEYLD